MSVWGARRQLLYFSAVMSIPVIALVFYFISTRPEPTCFDGIKNQDELDVDCAGICQAVCSIETADMITIWSRPFRIRDGVYGAAAFIENPNIFGIRELHYKFRLEDENGILVTHREGTTFVNPDERFVVVEPNISTGNRVPVRALIEFTGQSEWVRFDDPADKPIIAVRDKKLELDRSPRAQALLENRSLRNMENVTVPAVIFDHENNLVTASVSSLDILYRDEPRTVFFTWLEPLEEDVFMEIFPRVNRLDNL